MSIFQRRHYVKLAEFVKYDIQQAPDDELCPLCKARFIYFLTTMLQDENPNFKEDTFKKACGLSD